MKEFERVGTTIFHIEVGFIQQHLCLHVCSCSQKPPRSDFSAPSNTLAFLRLWLDTSFPHRRGPKDSTGGSPHM